MAATDSFFSDARKHLAEVDVYLCQDYGVDKAVLLQAALRRFKFLSESAAAQGIATISQFSADIIQRFEVLPKTAEVSPQIAKLLLHVSRFLRHMLKGEERLRAGHSLPPDWELFSEAWRNDLRRAVEQRLRHALSSPTTEEKPTEGKLLEENRISILVADDEELVRSLVVDILTSSGHRVFSVKNGREALDAINSGFFDLVFTDIKMPGVSGIDVLKAANKISADIEVVVMTGYATVENAAEAVRFGAYDYLTKPFQNTHELLAVAHRAHSHLLLKRRNASLLSTLQRTNDGLRRHAESLEDALLALEENRRALLHADRLKSVGELAAGVAHEINNPTTFIRGNLQTLEKFWTIVTPAVEKEIAATPESPLRFVLEEMPRMMSDMMTGTERISRIVSGLQSFAHQSITDERSNVNIVESLNSALDLIRNRIQGIVTLEVDLPDHLPPIPAAALQLTQVFLNLLVNAADALEGKRGALIKVSAESDGAQLMVHVSDNGSGVPEKIRQQIFSPFFTTKEVGKGTGLGLAISQGIMHDHGGVLDLESSREGWGSTFVARFPLAGNTLHEATPRVLIVDDDPAFCALMETTLRSTGRYATEFATSGEQALTLIAEAVPDLVILDLIMPDVDGFEIISRLRADAATADLKIMCITGLSEMDVENQLRNLGVQEVIFKPFKTSFLLEAMRRVFDQDRI